MNAHCSLCRVILVLAVIIIFPIRILAEKPLEPSQSSQVKKDSKTTGTVLKAYYFHGTRRCKTCLTIESNTKEILEKGFQEEISQGLITWQALDTDKKNNQHFQEDFNLLFSSLILVKYNDGNQVEWKNLQKVWELVWDKQAFTEYIQSEVKSFLE